ncbi:hypothetical protein BJY04DRAFT_204555 [Aspergillus karnatakaensis]|uniref:MFS transporter/fungal specific transcription factor domain-containing protein n=1 Tax=Aspergillus karnatakaensis TaxID=1810916 RepID=UPI003CCDB781
MSYLVGRPLTLAITATAGSGFLLFGYDQGVMSGLLTGEAFVRTFPEIDTTEGGGGSSSLQGTVVAIYEIGCFLGAILSLMYGERFGRRMCIMAGCVVLSIGAILQATAYGIPQMIVGRIVAGVGNGLNTSTIPVWHSELSKASSRGKGLAIELVINIFGVMTAYWVDYGMSYVNNESQFRFPLALQVLFAIITFLGILVLPESPRWLIAHDRHNEARKVLWSVQHNARLIDENDPVINLEMAEITRTMAEERQASEEGSFKMLLKNGPQRFRHRTLLAMGGQMMQQLSGVNLITYYNTVIFEQSVGMSHNLALLLAGFNGVAYFFSTFVPVWAIDRLGRRKLMLFAAAGQCGCMAILAGTVYDGGHSAGIVATVMLFLFNFFFAVGLLAIPWLLPAEYAPLAIRTRTAALATATNWIFTFLVVEITPVSIGNIGYKTYIYFAIFNFCFLPIIFFFYPETRNLTLEQIDRLFTGEKVLLHWDSSMGVAGDTEHRLAESKAGGDAEILTVEPSRRKDSKDSSSNANQEKQKTPVREADPAPLLTPVQLSAPSSPPVHDLHNPTRPNEPLTSPEQMVQDLTSPSNSTQFTNSDINQHYISSPEFMVDELTLQNLSNYQGMTPPLFDPSVFSDIDNPANDIFLPGSAYEALHTALRNRQLWTARPDIPSGPASPTSVPNHSRSNSRARTGRFELSPDRENILWQNYLNEICLWLDMFDHNRHFASTFPQMAKSAPHLRYSILALSARQIERKQNEKSQSESLSLYQEAIHLLLPELGNKTTPVIASCVILCVLEMLSCNPKEWRRHLDGCAYLIQAAEINGFSGKEEQALFWCFARMDVCGGLISEEETIIPLHNWIPPDMPPSTAAALFLASENDTYANYTVYLCAQTLSVLFRRSPTSVYPGSPGDNSESYVARWSGLFEAVEQWYENRPSQMKSIFSVSAAEGRERAFPTVLYANGAAISGNQLYHTCSLLLLQRRPKTLSLARRPRSVLWHARQICAISASNAHHGCWTNALQPLWIAGKVMSHHSEHDAIIETLTRIERETGWASAWRVEDLREFWGVDGDL